MREERKLQSIIVLSILVLTSLGILTVMAYSDRTVTILDGDDIIKNFAFEYYQPDKADSDPFLNRYQIDDGRLQVSYGGWNIKAIQVTGAVEKGNNEVEIAYNVILDNRFYIYTAVPLTRATSTLGNWNRQGYGYVVFNYVRYGCFGDAIYQYGPVRIDHNYYDFGDIIAWNAARHSYSGAMKFNFDISGTPFLETLYDSDGTTYTPTFSHISIYNGFLENGNWGYITQVNLEDQVIIADGKTEERASAGGAGTTGQFESTGGSNNKEINWNALGSDPFSKATIRQTWEDGVLVRGNNEAIDVQRKDGSNIWDPVNPTESNTDGAFIFHIGRVTPLVTEYWRTLTYYSKICSTTEDLLGTKTWHGSWRDPGDVNTVPKSSALTIRNRYVSYDVNLQFNIRTNYQLEVLREVPKVGQPVETYDKLIFTSGIAGGVSGTFGIMSEWGLFDYLIFIIILIVVAVIAITTVKLILKRRKKGQKGPESPNIHVHVK